MRAKRFVFGGACVHVRTAVPKGAFARDATLRPLVLRSFRKGRVARGCIFKAFESTTTRRPPGVLSPLTQKLARVNLAARVYAGAHEPLQACLPQVEVRRGCRPRPRIIPFAKDPPPPATKDATPRCGRGGTLRHRALLCGPRHGHGHGHGRRARQRTRAAPTALPSALGDALPLVYSLSIKIVSLPLFSQKTQRQKVKPGCHLLCGWARPRRILWWRAAL